MLILLQDDVVFLAREKGVVFDMHHDKQIAGRCALLAGIAIAAHLNLYAFADAGRNLDIEDGAFAFAARAIAIAAGPRNDRAFAAAIRASPGLHH